MKKICTLVFLLSIMNAVGQVRYGTPTNEPLPEKLQNVRVGIEVNNFPKTIDPVAIDGQYYWKHNTAILCKESEVKIIEYGAYLFYNGKWNLRRSYPLKQLDKDFGTKKQVMLQSQPYTWTDNWRVDSKLYDGWALWYFIGIGKNGEKVCGYEKIETTENLLNKSE